VAAGHDVVGCAAVQLVVAVAAVDVVVAGGAEETVVAAVAEDRVIAWVPRVSSGWTVPKNSDRGVVSLAASGGIGATDSQPISWSRGGKSAST